MFLNSISISAIMRCSSSSFFLLLIYFFMAVLGLHCCTGFSLVAVRGGYFVVAVLGLLMSVAPDREAQVLGCMGFSGFRLTEHGLNDCDAQA